MEEEAEMQKKKKKKKKAWKLHVIFADKTHAEPVVKALGRDNDSYHVGSRVDKQKNELGRWKLSCSDFPENGAYSSPTYWNSEKE